MEPHKQQEPQWQTELGLPSDSDGQDYDNEDSVALRKVCPVMLSRHQR